MKTSERLRRMSRNADMPVRFKADLRNAADEAERRELMDHARELAAKAGPQAASEPPWGWS